MIWLQAMTRKVRVSITMLGQKRGMVMNGRLFAIGRLGVTVTWLPWDKTLTAIEWLDGKNAIVVEIPYRQTGAP